MDCWTPTEHAGDATPYGLQHPLSRAEWDAAVFRDDLRGFVVGQLHDEEAVLVVDETGDLKKGVATVGVQRQYTTPPSPASEASADGSPPGQTYFVKNADRWAVTWSTYSGTS